IINIIIDIYLALGAVIVLSLFIDNLLFLMLPFMFILFLSGMLFPLNSSLAMLERNKNSGAAGGFIGFSMYIQGAIVTALLGLFKTNSITLSVSLLAVIILIIFTWIIFLNSEAESYS
ncbi:MAG: hypothetical protein GY756_03315, partial [bacterium]|nr:hypothetical protein [bacterium]